MSSRDQVIASIRAVAAHDDVPVLELSRDRFVEARQQGLCEVGEKICRKVFGSYGAARRAAALPLEPLPPGHHRGKVTTQVNAIGEVERQWMRSEPDKENREDILRRFLEDLSGTVERVDPIDKPKAEDTDSLACYVMGDPHLGLYAWGPEAGEDFDLAKGVRLLRGAADHLVLNEPRCRNALIVNLGDFFHADNQLSRTMRAGNPLDVDTRWGKVLRAGFDVMHYIVDRVRSVHERVKVINAIGNHDDHSAVMLSVGMSLRYEKEPRVEVALDSAPRHYHKFGECLIGVTHGQRKSASDLESIMASEVPKLWGETKHRYFWTGHVHHIQKKETRGVVCESFRTLAAKDAHSHAAGYAAGRDMSRIVLHRRWGEVSRTLVNVDQLERRA